MRVGDVKDHTSQTNKNAIHPENNSFANAGIFKGTSFILSTKLVILEKKLYFMLLPQHKTH